MTRENTRNNLSAVEHAVLFSTIVENTIENLGEQADETLKEAVEYYGNQRGSRMAQRTEFDGEELNLKNYIIYGEWAAREGEMDISFPELSPEVNMVAKKCPWYNSWAERDLLKEGAYYCRYIDPALAKGYNPELVLDTVTNRTEGAEKCDFYFRDNSLTDEDFKEISEKKKILGDKARKNWDYHIAHLFYAMKEIIIKNHGEIGEKIIEESIESYKNKFGEDSINIIYEFDNTDFSTVNDYVGING